MGYEFTSRVRYSECGQNEVLTYDHLADYFQDCTVFHDASVGMGMRYWSDKQAMWVLTAWKILIFDRPACGDLIRVRTDAIECKGFRGLRNFTMRNEEGKLLAAAHTKWALISTENGRPVRILPEEGDAYGHNQPLPIEEERERIQVPEDAPRGDAIEVMPFYLDSNHHVNNAQYIKLIQDLIPEDFPIHTLRVSYHSSATLGDVMYPRIAVGAHSITGALENADGNPFVIFEFRDCFSETDKNVAFL